MSGFINVAEIATPARRGIRASIRSVFVEPLRRARERARIHAELARMSDRDLADIGLTRAAIPFVANGTWGASDDRPRATVGRPANANDRTSGRAAA